MVRYSSNLFLLPWHTGRVYVQASLAVNLGSHQQFCLLESGRKWCKWWWTPRPGCWYLFSECYGALSCLVAMLWGCAFKIVVAQDGQSPTYRKGTREAMRNETSLDVCVITPSSLWDISLIHFLHSVCIISPF